MFDKDLFKKINDDGRSLTAEEERLLDLALDAQEPMRTVVQAMGGDEVNLTWRSQLNERVLELARQTQRQSRWLMIWRPALGLGLAGALALVFTLNNRAVQPTPEPSQPALEAALIQTHRDSVRASEIAGPGLASHEARPASIQWEDDPYDWNEVDVETL